MDLRDEVSYAGLMKTMMRTWRVQKLNRNLNSDNRECGTDFECVPFDLLVSESESKNNNDINSMKNENGVEQNL